MLTQGAIDRMENTKSIKTFYFNTGVKPDQNSYLLENGAIVKGGCIRIPFDCYNVPDNAIFKFACGYDDLTADNLICREIHNSKMIATYAYFSI